MTTITDWARQWSVSAAALADLQAVLRPATPATQATEPQSEARVSQEVRIEAAQHGILLFRNNVGVLPHPDNGRPVRFGLANDSTALNTRFKSGDFIGLRRNGQFVSREIKHSGWRYTGTEREVAQQAWIELVNAHGGDAAFATGRGTL